MVISGFAGCLVVLGVILVTPVIPDEVHDSGDRSVRLFYVDPWPGEVRPSSRETTAGVMETAVGGVCPPYMCENGGTCELLEGKVGCRCTPGFMGHACQDIRVELACDERGMGVRVMRVALAHLGVNVSALHTSSGRCPAGESPQYVTLTLTPHNHTQCGTQVKVNGSHLIYSNQLITETSDSAHNAISRSADLRISFSCVYQYDRVVSLPFPLLTGASVVRLLVEEGELRMMMTLHSSLDFSSGLVAPLIVPLTRLLYVQLQIVAPPPPLLFTLRLEECWATPGPDHTEPTRHPIITAGIPIDNTAAILDSGNQSLSRFSLQMFHFVKFPEFYLHCRVHLYRPDADPRPDPDASNPDPDTSNPDADRPDANRPDPDADRPDPDASYPDPDTSNPDSDRPDADRPDPDANRPDASYPDARRPRGVGRHIRGVSGRYWGVVSCGPIRVGRISVSSSGRPEPGLSPLLLPACSAVALILLLLSLVTIAKVLRAKLKALPPSCVAPPPSCVAPQTA